MTRLGSGRWITSWRRSRVATPSCVHGSGLVASDLRYPHSGAPRPRGGGRSCCWSVGSPAKGSANRPRLNALVTAALPRRRPTRLAAEGGFPGVRLSTSANNGVSDPPTPTTFLRGHTRVPGWRRRVLAVGGAIVRGWRGATGVWRLARSLRVCGTGRVSSASAQWRPSEASPVAAVGRGCRSDDVAFGTHASPAGVPTWQPGAGSATASLTCSPWNRPTTSATSRTRNGGHRGPGFRSTGRARLSGHMCGPT